MDYRLCTRKEGENIIVESADLFLSPIELMLVMDALSLKAWDEHSSISDKYLAQKMKSKMNNAYKEMEEIWEREVERREYEQCNGKCI